VVPDTGKLTCDVTHTHTHAHLMTNLPKIITKFTYASNVPSYIKKRGVHELVQFGGRIPRVFGFVLGYMARIQRERNA